MPEDDGGERRKSYMEKFVHWAEKSSFHAVPQMVISKNYLVKLLWLCCLILSTYACGKTVVTNLIDYFSYSVDTVLELDRDGQATFPTVTICRLQICGLDSQEYSKFLDGFLQQQEQHLNFTEPDVSEMLDLFRDYFLANYNKTELNHIFGNKSSKSIKDSLITCLYDGLECSADDFAYFQLDEFQACYSFNSGRNSSGQEVEVRQVRRFGKNYGLHLELFMGLPDDCKTPLSPNFGLVVYVHNASYVIWDENNGFEATPGYETDVAVDRTRLIKLPDPYSNCILNTEPPKNMDDFSQALRDTFSVTQSYTQQTCLQMCYQRFLADRYKCYDPSLPFINRPGLQTCTNAINSLTNSIYTDKADFYKEKSSQCLLDCPLECDSYTYKATLSNTEFPSLSYADLLEMKKNLTAELNIAGNSNNNIDDQKKNGFLSLNVFYKSDLITTITERPQTELEAFISELGGTLGLFLGISFLSFIELVEIVLEFILIKYDKVVLSKNRVHVIKVVPPMPDNKSSPKKTESKIDLFVKSKTVL